MADWWMLQWLNFDIEIKVFRFANRMWKKHQGYWKDNSGRHHLEFKDSRITVEFDDSIFWIPAFTKFTREDT